MTEPTEIVTRDGTEDGIEIEPLEAPEPLPGDPAATGQGATGTVTVAPAPGSDSTVQAAPSESATYIERAREALMQAFGTVPSTIEVGTDMLTRLTVLVLVKGDRCTPRDVHDSSMAWRFEENPGDPSILPWDLLDPREQQGLDRVTAAVQKAGRFMGRDGS